MKVCVLDETKLCNDCGECERCDLDPNKICDNCMRCVYNGAAYNGIRIDSIESDGTGALMLKLMENGDEYAETTLAEDET